MRFSSAVPLAVAAITVALSGCSGGIGALAPASPTTPLSQASHPKATASITHVVLIIQENRSFDNLFATFPKANGTTHGTMHTGQVITLTKAPLVSRDINHNYNTYLTDCDLQGGACKMDGFDLSGIDGNQPARKYPYRYVDPSQIAPYWTLEGKG